MATVRLFAAARAAAGTSQVEVAADTVGQALDTLVALHPGLAKVLPQCSLLLDEVACRDRDAALESQATLDVLPPFAGG